jgi:hypothetical protein
VSFPIIAAVVVMLLWAAVTTWRMGMGAGARAAASIQAKKQERMATRKK